jgi:hypothetical protein
MLTVVLGRIVTILLTGSAWAQGFDCLSAKALTQYAHRLNGLSARKKIASLRQRFLDEAAPIQSDLKTLRGAVRCPDDAPAG